MPRPGFRHRSRLDRAPAQRRSARYTTGFIAVRDLHTPLPEDVRLPPAYDTRDISAANSCRHGRATSEQQQRFCEYIAWAGGAYHPTYRPDPYDAAYAAGRREFAMQIITLFNTLTPKQSTTEQG